MRRILATFLLAVTSFTLVPAVLFASGESDLPACCRKNGKHKCSMAGMEDEASGATMRGVSQCPMFPSRASSAPASNVVGAPIPQSDREIRIAAILNTPEQVEAQYRVSFSRSRQKRGPPSHFSSSI